MVGYFFYLTKVKLLPLLLNGVGVRSKKLPKQVGSFFDINVNTPTQFVRYFLLVSID